MTGFKAAIFDLDGTLLDSMAVWEKIDINFLEKRNLEVPNSYINEVSAMSFKEAAEYTIKLFNLGDTVEGLINEWNSMAAYEYGHNITLKPHAKEYLMRLKSCGVRLAAATSLPKALYEPALINNGIYELFDELCGGDEVSCGKGFPDIFLLASKKLMIPPKECIVFEDLLQGIISAKKAGMKAFCVYDEYSRGQKPEILKIADGYIYNFREAPIPN